MENITFDLPKNQSRVIKVIGVGGGGSNAVNHMFRQGIEGVDFVICNTDHQALQNSPVPTKIQLGISLTEGLGAGANPEIGQQAALESIEEIENILDTNTKMVFITAGMGGGTGTGAAPVIAQLAKERGILTVGIVTIPFQFEGKKRLEQALRGVENLRANVDSLIVINNNKLREVYGNLGFKSGFSKADEVLATASKGIAELITHHYTVNVDLEDVRSVLSNSGTAIMGSAIAEGENRAKDAVIAALDSPLLSDNKIRGSKNVLLLIVSGNSEITMDEVGEINDHIQNEAGHNANILMGIGENLELGEGIAVTVIATGFNAEQQKDIMNIGGESAKVILPLDNNQKVEIDLQSQVAPTAAPTPDQPLNPNNAFRHQERIVHNLNEATHSPENAIEEPVVAKVTDINMIEVIEPEFVIEKVSTPVQQEVVFTFDLQEQQQAFEKEQEVETPKAEVEVPQAVESQSPERVVFDLNDFLEVEEPQIAKKTVEPVQEDEIKFEVRTEPSAPVQPSYQSLAGEQNPTDNSIEEILKNRADERRQKMKEFNHKFKNSFSQINELEKEPAYKRMGVDLDLFADEQVSRYSVGGNSDTLRSNNSFLHDNVD